MESSIQTGKMITVVGTGEPGYAGDGAVAVHAALNEHKNIAFDAQGNLYIADSENHAIRKVSHDTGFITTIAGYVDGTLLNDTASSPFPEFSQEKEEEDPLADLDQDSLSAFKQSIDVSGTIRYVAEASDEVSRFSGDDGLAKKALLNFPSGLAVGLDGTIYIADTWNHRIRKVDPLTGIMTTIAGTGQPRFSGDGGLGTAAALQEPVAVALDGKNCLYIADQGNNRVRMLDVTTGVMTTVVGNGESAYSGDGGPATEASVAGPSGLAIDCEGNLYVSDTFSSRVRVIDRTTNIISTQVGDGGEFRFQPGQNECSGSLSRPYGIALNREGHLLITDSDNHLLRMWNHDTHMVSLIAGNGMAQYTGEGQSPEQSSLNFPFGVAVHPDGTVYIADTFNHRIRMLVP